MYRRTSKVAGWPGFPTTAVVTVTALRVKRKKGTERRKKKKEEADAAGHIKMT